MSGTVKQYLLDTNILIYYFNGEAVVQPLIDSIRMGQSLGFYCPLTWIELLCYPALSLAEAEQIRQFLRLLTSVELTEVVLDRAAFIRHDCRTPLPDALIAACALESSCILITRNVSDFSQISQLTVQNPFSASP